MTKSKKRFEIQADADWFDRIRSEADQLGINISSFVRMVVSRYVQESGNHLLAHPSTNRNQLPADHRQEPAQNENQQPLSNQAKEPNKNGNKRIQAYYEKEATIDEEEGMIYLLRCTAAQEIPDPDSDGESILDISFEYIALVYPLQDSQPVRVERHSMTSDLLLAVDDDNKDEIFNTLGGFSETDLLTDANASFSGLLFLAEWFDDGDEWTIVPRSDDRVQWLSMGEARRLADEFDSANASLAPLGQLGILGAAGGGLIWPCLGTNTAIIPALTRSAEKLYANISVVEKKPRLPSQKT
jgi:hypothetical protein